MAAEATVGKRARRTADTRARLIDVSLDLYVKQGFGPTTIEQIAAAAGIGRSSFFHYFSSKQSVLFAPLLELTVWFLAELDARPRNEPPLVSVATVCTKGAWPAIDVDHLGRARVTFKAEPSLQGAFAAQLGSSFSRPLMERLLERSPHLNVMAVQIIADVTVLWVDLAMNGHVRDGRPLADHFADVIRTTGAVALELAELPGAILD